METKVIILLICIMLGVFFCCRKPDSQKKVNDNTTKYDTLWLGLPSTRAKYSEMFHVKRTRLFSKGVELETKGHGIEVDMDTVYYYHRVGETFVAVVGLKEDRPLLINYNGDSLHYEIAGIWYVTVNEYKTNRFTAFCIINKNWIFGEYVINKSFYKINNYGLLSEGRDYTSIRIKKGIYDTLITSKIKGDSMIIYKNGRIDYVYK
ncbi:MAG: hypothetical protein LWX56_04190 [Ignavibacteria bacterium]|nr:hypothetical protein [Ignavibacteria bacterium]